ncbi:MAG: hypothetical protein VCE91_03245 [Nitrospinota bacterium]
MDRPGIMVQLGGFREAQALPLEQAVDLDGGKSLALSFFLPGVWRILRARISRDRIRKI